MKEKIFDRAWLESSTRSGLVKKAKSFGVNFRTRVQLDDLLKNALMQHETEQDLYIFAYGSLMWNPIIHVEKDQHIGYISGYQRQFCINMPFFRGTPENPGLMLGLVEHPQSICHGKILQLNKNLITTELPLLFLRELSTTIYIPQWVNVRLSADTSLRALTFIIDQEESRLNNQLTLDQQAKRIALAEGDVGSNRDYLFNLAQHLKEYKIIDEDIFHLVDLVTKYIEP